jgi:hypothetical protein
MNSLIESDYEAMVEKKISREDLLSSLIKLLVDEWGYDLVRDRLNALSGINEEQSLEVSVGNKQHSREKAKKPTASVLAAKISLPPEQKYLIQNLAERYDSKRFLPTAGDIRYFFEMHGEAAPSSKQRIEVFRQVLKVLSAMQENALRKLIEDDAHSGPSRLGPLSEAIRTVGEQRLIGHDLTLEPVSDTGGNVDSSAGCCEKPNDT